MDLQELGSLYDLIHNDTVPIDREISLQLLRDICQGILRTIILILGNGRLSLPIMVSLVLFQSESFDQSTLLRRNAISARCLPSDLPCGPQELEHPVRPSPLLACTLLLSHFHIFCSLCLAHVRNGSNIIDPAPAQTQTPLFQSATKRAPGSMRCFQKRVKLSALFESVFESISPSEFDVPGNQGRPWPPSESV
jgi:hypothetical protein